MMPTRKLKQIPSRSTILSEKHTNKHTGWRSFRLWVVLTVVTLVVCERAMVFAAPQPPIILSSNINTNTTISRIITPRDVAPPPKKAIFKPESPKLLSQERNSKPEVLNKNSDEPSDTKYDEANLAFFLQISASTIHHLPRLLDRIYHEKNIYTIHLDLKIPENERRRIERDLYNNPRYSRNVHVMESELIIYRGVSMLLNTINSMRLLLEKGTSWDYYINISGSDYPLLTAESLRRLLGHHKGLNFFTFAGSKGWDKMAQNRLREMWYDESLTFRKSAKSGELTNLKARNPLVNDRDFVIAHSEAWVLNSREFCDFVVRGDMARKMLLSFAYSADSSEHYFASLALNHPKFKKTIVTHSLRHIIWEHEGKTSGQHPYNIDEKNRDGSYKFKQILKGSVLFFARKFEKVDSVLMDFLDQRAKNQEIFKAAETHLVNKIAVREKRVNEL